jgi:hypothetical protein
MVLIQEKINKIEWQCQVVVTLLGINTNGTYIYGALSIWAKFIMLKHIIVDNNWSEKFYVIL